MTSLTSYQQLRRAVDASLLWSLDGFEADQSIAKRIQDLAPKVAPELISQLVLELDQKIYGRKLILFLVRELARNSQAPQLVATTLATILAHPQDIIEFVALYWSEGKQPLSKQVKQGLAAALQKFTVEQFAQCKPSSGIQLRDILFLVHAQAKNSEQAAIWQQVAQNTLPTNKTWEQHLSSSKDKKPIFEDLLTKQTIPASAALANIRKLASLGISRTLIADYFVNPVDAKATTLGFVAAAQAVPAWQDLLENVLLKTARSQNRLPGKTLVLVNRASSMGFCLDCTPIEPHTDLTRADIALAITIDLQKICDEIELWGFTADSNSWTQQVINKLRGKAVIDTWCKPIALTSGFSLRASLEPQPATSNLNAALELILKQDYQRLIVITHQNPVPLNPSHGINYLINLECKQKRVSYGSWVRIDGISENLVPFIQAYEQHLG